MKKPFMKIESDLDIASRRAVQFRQEKKYNEMFDTDENEKEYTDMSGPGRAVVIILAAISFVVIGFFVLGIIEFIEKVK